MTKPMKQSYSFDFKLALVERFTAGETAQDLASEAGLSSPKLLETWARAHRREGPDAGKTVKVQALIALKADFPLPVLLQITGLAKSTFFYHQARLHAPDPRRNSRPKS
ncbi:transposase [Arthrobacter sp. ZGTC412]|uniref:transposase n=1 Tax=Arthrobacter sp. ZGTC412 TaxID=2058900 RepID=UPI0011B0A34F|nr:transposase [Arthrobacter sp. ZGTC412]